MNKMIKAGIIVAICAAAACAQSGQGANTIFQRMFSNQVATGVSANARAVGQQYHRLDVFLYGVGCYYGSGGEIWLEGSTDNANFERIGAPLTTLPVYSGAPYTYAASTSASGAYAYVRVNYGTQYTQSGGFLCSLTAYYSGSVTGTLTGSAPFTALTDTFQYATGSLAVTTPTAVITCYSTGTAMQLYMLAFNAPGGANNVTLQGGATGSGTVWTYKIGFTASNYPFVLPQGSRPYFFVPVGGTGYGALDMTLSAATEVDYTIAYRCE